MRCVHIARIGVQLTISIDGKGRDPINNGKRGGDIVVPSNRISAASGIVAAPYGRLLAAPAFILRPRAGLFLRARAARAELRQTEIVGRHAEVLCNLLYPDKTLQEREIAGGFFVARHGAELLRCVYDTIHIDCLDHQVISL